MQAWDIGDADLDAVIQYLKTFSPRWRGDPDDPIVPTADRQA